MNDYVAWALVAACVVIALLPPKWDPAIRLKERQIMRGEHPESTPEVVARLKALGQAANEQQVAKYPYCERGLMDCGSQTCGCLDTPHYRARWQSARADRIVENDQ